LAQEAECGLVPSLLSSLEHSFGLSPLVLSGHRMHRLLDYRENVEGAPPGGMRCHAHRDFGSFTLLWADTDGLEVAAGQGGEWMHAETGTSAVVVAGCALAVLSQRKIVPPLHRVPELEGVASPRRTAIALFVEPAKQQRLDNSDSVQTEQTYADLKKGLQQKDFSNLGASFG